ncbi:hypothetical protein MnTg01_01211 [archaeon MnTg01]|nr:hypothetical protein MnTg01_01211 [archaeon MnTg01]
MNVSLSINIKKTIILLITGIGIVLFWRGIWETSEELFGPEISLILGLGILILIAVVQRRQFFKFFGGG